ncbi:MAG TPA: lactate utilization protein [Gammaproteobacteria bacterium]|nr:lactate utilization protein [Gammaproteobacteria bacterium]
MRSRVLEAIRQALGRDAPASADDVVADYRESIPDTPPPRQTWDGGDAERLIERLEKASATAERIPSAAEIPTAVARYLAEMDAVNLRIGAHPDLQGLTWPSSWEVAEGPADAADAQVSVTRAFAAVAETGSLVMPSSPQRPTSLNFLPDIHVVVLREGEIVDYMEAVWPKLLAETGQLPRAVNFITGPSRTADVEQTLQLGAHGPRRLHVLLVT